MANHDIVDVAGALKTYVDTKTLTNLADVESTSTASKAYAVGDHLVYNGVLYKVTAAIASGATLVPDTNIEAAQVEDEIDDVKEKFSAHQQLLKDTVGWTGKNLFVPNHTDTATYNGVTCTYDPSDCGWTLNGTATDNIAFILYGWESPIPSRWIGRELKAVLKNKIQGVMLGGDAKDSSGNPVAFFDHPSFEITQEAVTANVYFWVVSGTVCDNLKVYPMICDANLPDEPFEKPHESVEEVMYPATANTALGAHNLFNNDMTSQVVNNVTFTVNADKTVLVNGTPSSGSGYAGIYTPSLADLPDGDYVLSGTPNTGSAGGYNKWYLGLVNANSNNWCTIGNLNDEIRFTKNSSDPANNWTTLYIQIYEGFTADNMLFKPMIRRADDPDPTYAPFTMTVPEITDFIKYMGGALDRTRQPGVSFSDLSFSELVNKEPGMYCVPPGASNEPDSDLNSGSYGNLLLFPMKVDNRNFGILAFDNGNVYLAYGYGSTQMWKCISCHMSTSVQINQTYFDNQYVEFHRKGEVVTLGIGISPKVSIPVGTYDLCDVPSRYRFDFGASNTALMNVYQVNGTVSAFVDSVSQKVRLQVGVAAANNASFIRGTMIWFTNQ